MRFSPKLAWGLLAVLLSSSSAEALTARLVPDDRMARDATAIVVGRVSSISPERGSSDGDIRTRVTVDVERVLKGEVAPGARIPVLQLGGAIGGAGVRVSSEPRLELRQEAVFFLTPDRAEPGAYRIAHQFMGLFRVVARDRQGAWVRRADEVLSDAYIQPSAADAAFTREDELENLVARVSAWLGARPAPAARASTVFFARYTYVGPGVRWTEPDRGAPVVFRLNSSDAPVSGGALNEITRGLRAWPQQAGAGVSPELGAPTTLCGQHSQDRENTISFDDCQRQLEPPTGCMGVLAVTHVAWSGETSVVGGRSFLRIVDTDVVFNRGFGCFLGNSANVAEVAAHEIGHALGMGHATDSGALMYPSAHGGGRGAALASDDVAGIRSLYPAPPPALPAVESVTIKRKNKILVRGRRLSGATGARVNGIAAQAVTWSNDADPRLIVKKGFVIGPVGTNSVVVVAPQGDSETFAF